MRKRKFQHRHRRHETGVQGACPFGLGLRNCGNAPQAKADCPSGTAKLLACDIMQNGTRIVRVHSLRCGSNFGKHQVVFATDGESITVTHQAENVEIFALGAVHKAEEMLQNKTN